MPTARTGIRHESPVLTRINAAHFDHMPYADFQKMPVEYQEMIIAAYETEAQVSGVLSYLKRHK